MMEAELLDRVQNDLLIAKAVKAQKEAGWLWNMASVAILAFVFFGMWFTRDTTPITTEEKAQAMLDMNMVPQNVLPF